MIVGSTEDVILTGERSALRKRMEEVGYLANGLNVANYIHTPEMMADNNTALLTRLDVASGAFRGDIL